VDTLPILAPRLAAFIKTSNMFEFSQGSITKRLHLSERVLSDGVRKNAHVDGRKCFKEFGFETPASDDFGKSYFSKKMINQKNPFHGFGRKSPSLVFTRLRLESLFTLSLAAKTEKHFQEYSNSIPIWL